MKRLIKTCALTVGLLVYLNPASAQTRVDPHAQLPILLERPHIGKFEQPSVEVGREVMAVEMAWQKRGPGDAVTHLRRAVEAILGKDVTGRLWEQISYKTLETVVVGDDAGSWVRLGTSPLLVLYDQHFDEVRILNEELDLLEGAGPEVGIDGVVEIAERFLGQLAQSGVVDPRLYHQAAIQVGYTVVGEGAFEEEIQPGRIVGYRVTYRPRLHGFQLVNAGVRLGITGSGQLASIRVGGVTPIGRWRDSHLEPSRPGGPRRVKVSVKRLMDRFYRQASKDAEPQVIWSRIMYVMPEDKSRAVIEPMLLITYANVHRTDEGLISSRRKTLAYSLTDAQAAPIDFDSPEVRHEQTEPTREAERRPKRQ